MVEITSRSQKGAATKQMVILAILTSSMLSAGCTGSKDGTDKPSDDPSGDAGKPRQYLTEDNFRMLQNGMDKVSINPLLGGKEKPTNENVFGGPSDGFAPVGDIMVWEEGPRKVYAKFDPLTGKVITAKKVLGRGDSDRATREAARP
jgi:hypothetical protein